MRTKITVTDTDRGTDKALTIGEVADLHKKLTYGRDTGGGNVCRRENNQLVIAILGTCN